MYLPSAAAQAAARRASGTPRQLGLGPVDARAPRARLGRRRDAGEASSPTTMLQLTRSARVLAGADFDDESVGSDSTFEGTKVHFLQKEDKARSFQRARRLLQMPADARAELLKRYARLRKRGGFQFLSAANKRRCLASRALRLKGRRAQPSRARPSSRRAPPLTWPPC